MATTAPGSPYVESSDLVANYPAVSEALAERVDTVGVLPFADSTARGTAIPSPTEGQYTYLQDTNATEYWDGSAWVGRTGLYESIAIICDRKANASQGGTFTSGAYRTRDLNTEITDADGIVSIASNQFTLQAGTYTIEAIAPCVDVQTHIARIYNITDSSVVQISTAGLAWDGGLVRDTAIVKCVLTIAAAKTFELQHRSEQTLATNGFGFRQAADTSQDNIYSIVTIYKHS